MRSVCDSERGVVWENVCGVCAVVKDETSTDTSSERCNDFNTFISDTTLTDGCCAIVNT